MPDLENQNKEQPASNSSYTPPFDVDAIKKSLERKDNLSVKNIDGITTALWQKTLDSRTPVSTSFSAYDKHDDNQREDGVFFQKDLSKGFLEGGVYQWKETSKESLVTSSQIALSVGGGKSLSLAADALSLVVGGGGKLIILNEGNEKSLMHGFYGYTTLSYDINNGFSLSCTGAYNSDYEKPMSLTLTGSYTLNNGTKVSLGAGLHDQNNTMMFVPAGPSVSASITIPIL